MIIVVVVGALVVLLALAAFSLRIRKLRRDTFREITRSTDRRLLTPPPSPYATSKGFRLIDESGTPIARPDPVRPRLESDREYVFSDSQMPSSEEPFGSSMRKNELWALSRSAHRPKVHVTTLRVSVGLALFLIVLVVGAYLFRHHSGPAQPISTSTTTTSAPSHSSVATSLPTTLRARSTRGQSATYGVPITKYRVSIRGAHGPSWATFAMGSRSTLEWQGTVKSGAIESLQLTGDSSITLGSPGNASVTVDKSPVAFPSPLPSTLTLNFAAPTG